jgi:hypothetical protein
MKTNKLELSSSARTIFVSVALLISGFGTGSAIAAQGIDADADKILKNMSSYMAKLPAFSLRADIDNEIITNDGQKLQFSSFSTMSLQRSGKYQVERKGMFADAELIYDGQTLSIYGKNLNAYAQIKVSGTTDDAIRAVEQSTGLSTPGADLLFSNPYATLSDGVVRGVYLGTTLIDEVECHHLAFREDKVDWQLWVKAGNEPLPMKYVITNKWVTGAPQYSVRLQQWNTKPRFKPGQFVFTAPKGATKIGVFPVNEMGELDEFKEDK